MTCPHPAFGHLLRFDYAHRRPEGEGLSIRTLNYTSVVRKDNIASWGVAFCPHDMRNMPRSSRPEKPVACLFVPIAANSRPSNIDA